MHHKIIERLAAVIGTGHAYELARRWAGTELYVPVKMLPDHPIALAIGFDAAQLLSKEFGNSRLRMPLEKSLLIDERNRLLYADKLGGMSFTKVARKYGLTRPAAVAVFRRMRESEQPEQVS